MEANDGDSLTAIVRCLAGPPRPGAVFREIKGTDAALDLTVSQLIWRDFIGPVQQLDTGHTARVTLTGDGAAVEAGDVVGVQSISARDLAITRQVSTGSWLGRLHQGQGIGTEMRAAVLHLAFAGLNAQEALSNAFKDNHASHGVSRKLGYQPNGIDRRVIRGATVTDQRLRLTRAAWDRHRTIPVTVEGLEPCLHLLGLGTA